MTDSYNVLRAKTLNSEKKNVHSTFKIQYAMHSMHLTNDDPDIEELFHIITSTCSCTHTV